MTLESAEIDEIEKRAAAATGGPWEAVPPEMDGPDRGWVVLTKGKTPWARICWQALFADTPSNLDFIAHAREDIPALIESLRARDELLAECKNALELVDADLACTNNPRAIVPMHVNRAMERISSVLARFAEKETPHEL